MELVDTHCHIQSAGAQSGAPVGERHTRELWAKAPALSGDQIIANAREAEVTKLLCVGCDLEDSQLAIDFVKSRDNCWATIGIHPHEAGEALAHGRTLPQFAALAHCHKVVAVGECGLDYYYQHSARDDQIKVLEFQMALAAEAGLPMIFHVREAFDDFWPVFDNFDGQIRGVLHSFTDSRANLDKALERGLYLGVNGIVTFVKDPDQLAIYRMIPLAKLLLETDAPFLTPVPFRGKINESRQVRTIAEFLAALRGESLDRLSEETTANARKLFDI